MLGLRGFLGRRAARVLGEKENEKKWVFIEKGNERSFRVKFT